jgi:hypothetical protein
MSTNTTSVSLLSQLTLLTVSLAYFVYDSICCELIKHDLPNLLHHLATILGLWVGVLQLRSGPELTVCLVLMVSADSTFFESCCHVHATHANLILLLTNT